MVPVWLITSFLSAGHFFGLQIVIGSWIDSGDVLGRFVLFIQFALLLASSWFHLKITFSPASGLLLKAASSLSSILGIFLLYIGITRATLYMFDLGTIFVLSAFLWWTFPRFQPFDRQRLMVSAQATNSSFWGVCKAVLLSNAIYSLRAAIFGAFFVAVMNLVALLVRIGRPPVARIPLLYLHQENSWRIFCGLVIVNSTGELCKALLLQLSLLQRMTVEDNWKKGLLFRTLVGMIRNKEAEVRSDVISLEKEKQCVQTERTNGLSTLKILFSLEPLHQYIALRELSVVVKEKSAVRRKLLFVDRSTWELVCSAVVHNIDSFTERLNAMHGEGRAVAIDTRCHQLLSPVIVWLEKLQQQQSIPADDGRPLPPPEEAFLAHLLPSARKIEAHLVAALRLALPNPQQDVNQWSVQSVLYSLDVLSYGLTAALTEDSGSANVAENVVRCYECLDRLLTAVAEVNKQNRFRRFVFREAPRSDQVDLRQILPSELKPVLQELELVAQDALERVREAYCDRIN